MSTPFVRYPSEHKNFSYGGITEYDESRLRSKAARQLRCPRCGAFLSTAGQQHKCRIHPQDDVNRPPCPRCGGHYVIKMGRNIWGIQIYHCGDCSRRFREMLLPRTDYDDVGRGRTMIMIESNGSCLRCGRRAELANGLCAECSDNSSNYQRHYYRRVLAGICVFCGLAKNGYPGIACHSCSDKRTKYQSERRNQHKGARLG